ncbi:MAG TPA: MMPL family transporter [Mycobacteriales bacterium]|jgi:RND superfamily putative drug exporter
MATRLYRLGRLSFRRRRWVVALWLAILVAVGTAAGTFGQPTSDEFSIPGTESQSALDLLGDRFPEMSAGGATARVVFAAGHGTLADPAAKAAVQQTVATLREAPQVVAVTDPYQAHALSRDGTIGYAQVQYGVQSPELTDAALHALSSVGDAAEKAGVRVEIGGDALQAPPQQSATEALGVLVAGIVLVITFGSLIAAGLPLLTAFLAIGLSIAGITAATAVVDLSSTAPVLAMMLGLAVAIDYSLFIVSRYRHEVAEGRSGEEAAGRAVGTAGSAVVFAGATVVIALSALAVVGIPFLTAMGLAAAGAVAVAVLVALTVIPAMLGFAGRRVLGRRAKDAEKAAAGARWGRFVTRHRVPVLVASVLALGILAIPVADLQLGMPDDGSAAAHTTQRQAYDLVAKGFGPGSNGPLLVVVDTAHAQPGAAATVAAGLSGLDGVAAVTPPVPNRAGDTALLTVVPQTGPGDSATQDLVTAIRHRAAGWAEQTGADVSVTGQTAMMIDISEKLAGALLPYLAVIIGLAIILLMLVFRSILVPLKATLGFLLTIGATFGAVVAVFQWGWLGGLFGVDAPGPILSMLPIFMIGVVFGLAMDYELFLVTRMREEFVHGASPTEAVVGGLGHGARVVTAAALIMISVFIGFVFSGEEMIMSMGFAMAAGVAIDAFVVRMTIVPAVMSLLGRGAWWLPRWLDRVLPDVDVEGEKLRALLEPAREHEPTRV